MSVRIRVDPLTPEQKADLERLAVTSRKPRLRARAKMILLAGESRLLAPEIGHIMGENPDYVRLWIKRYKEQGIEGLQDAPRTRFIDRPKQ